jgi:DNA-directed RNA polymerase alpha subunit
MKRTLTPKPGDTLYNLTISDTIITALHKAGVNTITELCRLNSKQLASIEGLGPKKQILLKEALKKMGRSLSAAVVVF